MNILKVSTFLTFFLFGCQQQPVASQHEPTAKSTKTEACPYELSQTFRAAAGDAFDKLQSLESNELQGKFFYQPAYQDTNVAVSKVERLASNADEVQFSNRVTLYLFEINLYRQETELTSIIRKGEQLARENSDIMPDVYEQHPELRPTTSSRSVLKEVVVTDEQQKKLRGEIGGCLNASH